MDETESIDCVECSDEEGYFEPQIVYRTKEDGSRIWEPRGEDIVLLYEEIEAKTFNPLDWKCPGRISPSQLDQLEAKVKANETNDSINTSQIKSEFDFDNDFDDDDNFGNNQNNLVTKRTNQGKLPRKKTSINHLFPPTLIFSLPTTVLKKSQTNLSKVMQNIKKYKVIGNVNAKVKQTSTTSLPPPSSASDSSHVITESTPDINNENFSESGGNFDFED